MCKLGEIDLAYFSTEHCISVLPFIFVIKCSLKRKIFVYNWQISILCSCWHDCLFPVELNIRNMLSNINMCTNKVFAYYIVSEVQSTSNPIIPVVITI